MSNVNVLKLNQEIIYIIAKSKGFVYNGENIFTYAEWLAKGFRVIKDERAFFTTYLWTKGINRRKTLQSLFTSDQVVKVYTKALIMV